MRTLKHLYWNLTVFIEKRLFIRSDCAWCGKVLRRPLFPHKGRISHTMCRACAVEQGVLETIST